MRTLPKRTTLRTRRKIRRKRPATPQLTTAATARTIPPGRTRPQKTRPIRRTSPRLTARKRPANSPEPDPLTLPRPLKAQQMPKTVKKQQKKRPMNSYSKRRTAVKSPSLLMQMTQRTRFARPSRKASTSR